MIRLTVLISLLLVVTIAQAGQGRQTDTIEVDYDYRTVCRWIEKNAKQLETSTGADVIETAGDIITLSKETKYGREVFRIERSSREGRYSGRFVDRSVGSLCDYGYDVIVQPIEMGRSQITITMTAESGEASGVAIAVELRRSIRGVRAFLQKYLVKAGP